MLFIYISMLETEEEKERFIEVYNKYKDYMIRFARSFLKSDTHAEDAVHEAFISMIKNKNKYFSKNCPDLRHSIVIITKNKCIDIQRKMKNINENIDDHEYYLESDITPMHDVLIKEEEYDTLRSHILMLDDVSISILEMRYKFEMTPTEIAEETGMTLENVYKKLNRAKARIRKCYNEGSDK